MRLKPMELFHCVCVLWLGGGGDAAEGDKQQIRNWAAV